MEIMSCINYTNDINGNFVITGNNVINGNNVIHGKNVFDIISINIINGCSSFICQLSKLTFFLCRHYNHMQEAWRSITAKILQP